MPIPLRCNCGHEFEVGDFLAGLPVKCLECSATLTAPRPAGRPVAVGKGRDGIVLNPISHSGPLPHVDLPPHQSKHPLPDSSVKERPQEAERMSLLSLKHDVGRGLAAIGLAILIFPAGMWHEVIFIFSIVLFLAGFAVFMRGLTRRA